jgi:hypothetical protein
VFTDTALYSLQYVGPPFVWSTQLLGDNTSLVGPNAAVIASGVVYWMGVDKFYMYDGRVQTLNCDLRRYVFNDFNVLQSQQVYAGTNEGFNEIWWFYCSAASEVIDKYVIYNHLEQTWYYGNLTRTAWADTPLRGFPTALGYAPVTTTTQLAKETDRELIAGASANQVSRLVKQAESNKGGALLIDGKPVPVDVRTTPSSITLTYRNASVEVKCFDKDGSEIALSDDNRFTLRHGDAIKVVATGFSPGSSINVAVFSDPVAFGEVTVGQQGTASQQWPIPNSINAGNHTLVASGDLAAVEDTVLGLRIVVDEQSLVSRIASNTWTRIIIAFGIFLGLLIPANRRRRKTA